MIQTEKTYQKYKQLQTLAPLTWNQLEKGLQHPTV